jgi:hypothetical protein
MYTEVVGVQVIHGPSTKRRMQEVVVGMVAVVQVRVVLGVVGMVKAQVVVVVLFRVYLHQTHQVPLEVVEVVVLQEPTVEMD